MITNYCRRANWVVSSPGCFFRMNLSGQGLLNLRVKIFGFTSVLSVYQLPYQGAWVYEFLVLDEKEVIRGYYQPCVLLEQVANFDRNS